MAEIGMLWIGNPLTKIELISLHSFLYYNHDVTVYLYDQSIELPDGIKKADANKIVDESKVFTLYNSVSTFSDFFRYNMIKKTGKTWADIDTICVSKDWDFKSKTYASYIGQDVCTGVLSIDKDEEVLDFLIENSSNIYNKLHEETLNYRIIGSILLTEAFKKFDLMKNVLPEYVLTGLSYSESEILFKKYDPSIINYETKSISIYNSNFRGREHEKNNLPKGSFLEYYYNKYVIGAEND
jgi:hypothetical protein